MRIEGEVSEARMDVGAKKDFSLQGTGKIGWFNKEPTEKKPQKRFKSVSGKEENRRK